MASSPFDRDDTVVNVTLNDAYRKGVEDERARVLAALWREHDDAVEDPEGQAVFASLIERVTCPSGPCRECDGTGEVTDFFESTERNEKGCLYVRDIPCPSCNGGTP